MTIFRVYFRRKGGSIWSEPNVLLVSGRKELERILARKTPIAVAWERAKLHRCSGCDRRGAWDKGWAWAGGWIGGELNVVAISCSDPCREKIPRPERGWTAGYEPLPYAARAKRQTVGMSESDRAALTRARRSVPLPEGWKGAGQCRWCLCKIEGKYAHLRNWHPDCKTIWLLHSDRDFQTRFLIERDGHDCVDCQLGGRWWRVDLKLAKYAWEAVPICLLPTKRTESSWAELYPDAGLKIDGVIVGLYSLIEWRPHCGGLEVDHEIPLWSIWHLPDDERRKFYGPENIKLRCTVCHKAKSKREAAERAALKQKDPVDLDA